MSKTFLKISFGMLAVVGMVCSAGAAVGTRTLSGHVPAIVSHLSPIGQVEGTNRLSLAIGLPLRNQEALTNLLTQINDPSSSNYRQYLTPGQFTDRFGPTEKDYQAVADFARAKGLSVNRVHGNRMLLEVGGRVSDIQNAFNVTLRKYHHPTENREFFSPDTEPSVPENLAILDVSGLSSYARPHSKMVRLSSPKQAAQLSSKLGSGPSGLYMGADFRAAYVPGTTLTGVGQKVALVQFDGYLASDIALYEQKAGLASVSLTNILLNGFSGAPTGTSGGGEVEVSLDIEMVISMAPGVKQVMVYEGNPDVFNPSVVLNQIAMDNAARQVSCSWGWSGGPSATSDQIFMQMALQGQSFFNASGDDDAFLPGEVDSPTYNGYPSSTPYITQVGGTTLTTSGPGGARVSEMVWNWGLIDPTYYDGVGSSGGISSYYAIPSWQQGLDMVTNHGSATMRNIPDVACTGDNVYVIADNGMEYPEGGTSCAAPLWAGFMALANQQAAANGKSGGLGLINSAIYTLAKTTAYTNVFNDVTNGNNTWSYSPTNFYAVPGYDLCTGLGTPNGTNLINALTLGNTNTNTLPIIAVTAPDGPWGTNLAALNGDNPNGPWFLFVQDTAAPLGGVISNGWFITLTTADPVGFAADNQLYATPATLSLAVGQSWNFTLAVTNYGPSISTNVYVTNNLPVGLTLVPNLPANVSVTGTWLTWNVGTLANNAGASLTLSFTNGLPGVIYTNSAGVFSVVTTDPNPDDDTIVATAVFQSQSAPNLTAFSYTQAGGFQFAVTNSPGQTVIIQASTNLVNWIPVYTNVEPFTYVNTDATNLPMRFYRAVTAQ